MVKYLSVEFPGAFYHVCSRGSNKQVIFYDDSDFTFFLQLCSLAHSKHELVVHSYCLMTNHYHLFIETPKGNLSQIMKFINERYAMYFLRKYRDKDGHVFRGRYKRFLVQEDLYAKNLSRYIHLNPVSAQMVKCPEDWRWSSYKCFIGLETKPDFLNTGYILDSFSENPQTALKFYKEYMHENIKDDHFEQCVHGSFIGTEEFAATHTAIEVPLNINRSADDIEQLLERVCALEIKRKQKYQLMAYLLKEKYALSLKEIAHYVPQKPKTISRSIGLFKSNPAKNKKLIDLVECGGSDLEDSPYSFLAAA